MLGAADMPIGCALTFLSEHAHQPSCPALCRASTSCFEPNAKDVDGRDKPGHDASRGKWSKDYAVGWRSTGCRSRWRALRPKNRAWLTTAETTASWNGFAIRKAGSGRCPVRKRSG